MSTSLGACICSRTFTKLPKQVARTSQGLPAGPTNFCSNSTAPSLWHANIGHGYGGQGTKSSDSKIGSHLYELILLKRRLNAEVSGRERAKGFHTWMLTSAPLFTNSSRHKAPCVEAAAKCKGVNPLWLGWFTLAP